MQCKVSQRCLLCTNSLLVLVVQTRNNVCRLQRLFCFVASLVQDFCGLSALVISWFLASSSASDVDTISFAVTDRRGAVAQGISESGSDAHWTCEMGDLSHGAGNSAGRNGASDAASRVVCGRSCRFYSPCGAL